MRKLSMYIELTETTWTSFHINLLPLHVLLLALHTRIYLPPPNPDTATQQFIKDVKYFSVKCILRLILENMPSTLPNKYNFQSDPERLTHILETTDCDLLLDLPHAQIAANRFGMDVHKYLECLPLQRTRQIHVSGTRYRNGHHYDAHEPLQEHDYDLLEWTLMRTTPEVVTLEYFREHDALRQQLLKLRQLIP
jgi:uncharacterized protein (UPF0276 family)